MLRKELCMSINEFNAVQRGELSYKDLRKAENCILNNNRLRKATVVFMACGLAIEKLAYAAGPNLGGLESAGRTLLETAQAVGYWACLIMALVQIIMALLNGRNEEMKGICIKYIVAFASLYFMPWIFTLIKELFQGL